MDFWTKAGFTSKAASKPRGRPSNAAKAEEDEPLRHSPRKQQQQQQAKVKKSRTNWSLPENQAKVQKAIDEWKAQKETVRTERRT